jgi:hypothetical protein
MGHEVTGNYASWNYFQSLDTPNNPAFIEAWQAYPGSSGVTSDPMEAAYISLYLYKALVEAAGSFDVDAINQTPAETAGLAALVSRAGITADDTGSAWVGAPALLSFSAVLANGSATTVLLEVRDAVGTVATAATITADTVSQVLRQSLLLRQQSEYRFRRSSGTGSVTITV